MKGLIKILFFVILLFAAVYLYMNCVFKVESGRFGLVEDRESGDIIKILNPGYSFIINGIIPGKISIVKFSKINTQFLDLRIPIPLLEELKSDFYSIRVPITVQFKINPDKLTFDIHILKNGKAFFSDIFAKYLEGYFNSEFTPYFTPSYRKNALARDIEKIVSSVESSFKNYCLKTGIEIIDFRIIGNIGLPDMYTYYDGMSYYRELMVVEKNNKKELIILRSKLQKDKIRSSQFYEKLEVISKIIKRNPDILKYIYIEKMADNVKVIISPDGSGMPFGLNFNSFEKKTSKKGEINNLR